MLPSRSFRVRTAVFINWETVIRGTHQHSLSASPNQYPIILTRTWLESPFKGHLLPSLHISQHAFSYDLELPEHNFRNIFQKALDFLETETDVFAWKHVSKEPVKKLTFEWIKTKVRKCCLMLEKEKGYYWLLNVVVQISCEAKEWHIITLWNLTRWGGLEVCNVGVK